MESQAPQVADNPASEPEHAVEAELYGKKRLQRLAEAGKATRFEGYRAREAGKASAEARAALRLEAESVRETIIPSMPLPAAETDGFRERLRMRVRKQISKVMDTLVSESDSKACKELTESLDRLCEIDRKLSGIPLPGSLRPRQESRKRVITDVTPLD